MKKTAIVYWLRPEKDERELFCEIIRILCHELSAPNFDPHLTLLISGKNPRTPKEVLRRIKAGPIRLKIRGTASSPEFTKTLFVRFRPNEALQKLIHELGGAAKVRATSVRDPHVSLLYKKMPPHAKKVLASILKLPFRTVLFDSVVAVRLTLPVRTGANVSAWKIVARKSLRR